MNQIHVENLFRVLQLETEEERAAMRFESLVPEGSSPIQVFTTDSTCSVAEPERREFA
jgi:hypothetical protein